WPCSRVLPIGEDWIESDWLFQVSNLLRTSAMPPSTFPDRFRNWYAYERDCNAKTLAMLESVPQESRAQPNFQRAIDKMAHLIATLVKDLGGKPMDTDYMFWCGTPQKLEPASP